MRGLTSGRIAPKRIFGSCRGNNNRRRRGSRDEYIAAYHKPLVMLVKIVPNRENVNVLPDFLVLVKASEELSAAGVVSYARELEGSGWAPRGQCQQEGQMDNGLEGEESSVPSNPLPAASRSLTQSRRTCSRRPFLSPST
jgi:hypothetical protein